MERSAQGGALGTGQHVDESDVTPNARSYEPPLRVVDQMRLRMGISQRRISVDWRLTVVKGMQASADFLVVSTASLTTAAAAASLCYAWRAAGLTALMISGGFGVVTFAVGLVYVLVRRAHD